MALDTESLLTEKARLEKQIKQAELEISYNGGLAQLSTINPNSPTATSLRDSKARLDSSTSYLDTINEKLAASETSSTAQQSTTTQENTPLSEPKVVDVTSQPPVVPVEAGTPAEKATPTEEDPMAAAIAANQATNEEESPTEQKVIDSSSDAKMSQEEQGQLREYQETQRAKLKAEESIVPPKATPTIDVVASRPKDWRVRMSLAPSADYLYNVAKEGDLLFPLQKTRGVIFPYVPTVQTGYRANYEPADIAHTNYKSYFYKNSSVDDVSVTAEFTAQDITEARYLLAVIHFFKSVTKMFYGQDKAPVAGTPPPLVYLSGFGSYQYDNHPMVITSFTYSLPNDVDYIRTESTSIYKSSSGTTTSKTGSSSILDTIKSRLGILKKGGGTNSTVPDYSYLSSSEVTYVPTKLQITLTGHPIVTRREISQQFSLAEYAKGTLNKGSTRGSGIW